MAEAAPGSTEDPFMAAAKGHVPLSTNAGSANTWFPEGKSRPDREYDKLWWWSGLGLGSAIGLTDFYLRSPLTGFLKLALAAIISAGTGSAGLIVLVIWGLWEFLHIWTEKERVVNYGLSAPFDLWHGVGQGMVTDKATNYAQSTNFTVWQILSILDFAGLQSLYERKYALFIRKALDFTFFSLCVRGILRGFSDGSTGAVVWGIIFALIFGMFVFIPYGMTLRNALNPVKMFKDGYKIDPKTDQFLNFFSMWTTRFGPKTREGVVDDFGFKSVAAKVLADMFEIRHDSEPKPATEEADNGSANPTWPMSLLIGNAAGPLFWIFGEGIALIVRLLSAGVGVSFSTMIETTYAVAEGGLAGAAGSLVGSVGSMVPGGAALGERAGAVTNPIAAVPGLGSVLEAATNPAAALATAVPGIGNVTRAVANPAAALATAVPGIGNVTRAAAIPGIGAGSPLNLARSAAAAMKGGAHRTEDTSLSTEAIALGATVAALIAGGAIKLAVDSLMTH